MNFEHNSQLVKIGSALHRTKNKGKKSEVFLDGICVDRLEEDYIVEYKKSNSGLEGTKWQVYYYLYVLNQKGLNKKGKIICFENSTGEETLFELVLTDDIVVELKKIEMEIFELISKEIPPLPLENKEACSGCSYSWYCFL